LKFRRKKPLIREIGESWLARETTANSLQCNASSSAKNGPFCFIETARLLKATGEPLRAVNEPESSSTLLGPFSDQLTAADAESDRMKAKVGVPFDY